MRMRYLLDTNIIIFVLKDTVGMVALRLRREPVHDVVHCSVVAAELYYGATRYGVPERRRIALDGFLSPYRSLPFDADCVPYYAKIRDQLERGGQAIGGNDLMIAAIAMRHDLTLVTHNSGEFQRVSGLRVEDWTL